MDKFHGLVVLMHAILGLALTQVSAHAAVPLQDTEPPIEHPQNDADFYAWRYQPGVD